MYVIFAIFFLLKTINFKKNDLYDKRKEYSLLIDKLQLRVDYKYFLVLQLFL